MDNQTEFRLDYQIDWQEVRQPTDSEVASLIGYVNSQRAFHIPDYGDGFHAYFLPKGWASFGNAVRFDAHGKSLPYRTQEEAKAECEKHLSEYGLKASCNSRLIL